MVTKLLGLNYNNQKELEFLFCLDESSKRKSMKRIFFLIHEIKDS